MDRVNYMIKLQKFVQLLEKQQIEGLQANGIKNPQLQVVYETGRKFDKIIIRESGTSSVRFFVEKNTERIFGAKSRFSPNTNWKFATLDNVDKWSWFGYHPMNVSDASMRAIGSYGPYTSYQEV